MDLYWFYGEKAHSTLDKAVAATAPVISLSVKLKDSFGDCLQALQCRGWNQVLNKLKYGCTDRAAFPLTRLLACAQGIEALSLNKMQRKRIHSHTDSSATGPSTVKRFDMHPKAFTQDPKY